MTVTTKYIESIQSALRFGNRTFERKTVIKLIEHINEIESENSALLQQLIDTESMARNRVVTIPLEVAKAIEYFRYCSFSNIDFARVLFKPISHEDNKNTLVIKKFIYEESHGDVLMEALVNGYTVETLESKIEAAVLNTIDEVNDDAAGYVLTAETGLYLSQKISEAVAKVIREDQAAAQQQ